MLPPSQINQINDFFKTISFLKMEGLEYIEQANNLTSNGLVEWRDFALGKLDDIEKLLDEEEMPVDIVQSVKEHASFGF